MQMLFCDLKDSLKDKFGVGIIVDKIEDCTVVNGESASFQLFSFLSLRNYVLQSPKKSEIMS